MSERLNRFGLSAIFIDAVDGRALSDADKSNYLDLERRSYLPHQLSAGALGCSLSHLSAWQALIASNHNYALILEDDAELTASTGAILESLTNGAHQFDIISLHHRKTRPQHKIADLHSGHILSVLRYNHIGATAYLISRDAATRLLKTALPITFEIDLYINRWWQHGVQNLFIYPPLAAEDGRPSTIGYTQTPPSWPNDTWVSQMHRRLNRLIDSLRKRIDFLRYLQNAQKTWRVR